MRAAPLAFGLLGLLALLAVADAQDKKADITTCGGVATALNVTAVGSTIFCPNNKAWIKFCRKIGVTGPLSDDNVVGVIAGLAGANKDALDALLAFHILPPVQLITKAQVPVPATLPTSLLDATLQTANRGNKLELRFAGATVGGVSQRLGKALVTGADLTFEGSYQPGNLYIIHAIDEVMIPKVLEPALRNLRKAGRSIKIRGKLM